jgi:hypothetical protein
MRPIAYVAGLALLTVACGTVEKKEDPAASDSAAAAAAAVTAEPLMPGVTAAKESPRAAAKSAPKKSTSRKPGADSMRDSATEAVFEVDPAGKVTRIKK